MSGKCLCGRVKFTAIPESNKMDACHCNKCRKWSGGLIFAVPCVDLKIEDENEIKAFQSSDWGERLFCKNCGSNLFWRMLDRSIVAVMIQSFDNPSAFEFACEAFIDEKPQNYEFANDTKKMTGEEFMAIYSS